MDPGKSESLNRQTRKLLTIYRVMHPKSDVVMHPKSVTNYIYLEARVEEDLSAVKCVSGQKKTIWGGT